MTGVRGFIVDLLPLAMGIGALFLLIHGRITNTVVGDQKKRPSKACVQMLSEYSMREVFAQSQDQSVRKAGVQFLCAKFMEAVVIESMT